jgi:hypothetical protein
MPNPPVRTREDIEMWEQLLDRGRIPSCTGLVIEGVQFHCNPHSNAQNPNYVREEDEFAAWNVLEWHRKKFPHALPVQFEGEFDTWQNWMMYLLPHVAKHYAVSKDAVLKGWCRDCAPTILYETTGQIWIPKPSSDETL